MSKHPKKQKPKKAVQPLVHIPEAAPEKKKGLHVSFVGPHNSGKTTLIKSFIEKWPMYKSPEKTYRDIIKEKGLVLNKLGSKESQKAILNALIDEAQLASTSGEEYMVFDRCVIDNLAYSLWHHAKGTEGFSKEFIIDCQALAALTLKHFDVLFYVPARPEIPFTPREGRETEDEAFREEIDNIFQAMIRSYEKQTGSFFPLEDCPAVITLEGPPDMRLPQVELYIKPNGKPYGEEDGSLISKI